MSIQHANRGVVKKDLQLYYNREWVKSFRGEATTNFILQTENLTNSWTGNLFNNWINATVTANADLAPDGSLTASRLTGGYARWTNSITVSASVTYTASIWLKNISLGVDPGINIATGLNGTLVSYVVANTTITRSTIANWRRVSITYTIPASGVNQIQFGIRYEGDYPNQNSILVWGAQFEQKAYASTYLANSSASSISRTNTIAGGGGLLDISGNNYNIDLTSTAIAFDSGGYYFNANAQGAITTPVANSVLDNLSNNSHTYECWFKLLGTPPGLYGGYFFGRQGYHSGFYHDKGTPNVIYATTWYNDVTNTSLGTTLSLNTWYQGVFITDVENAMRYLYINGVLRDSATLTKQLRQYASTTPYYIGAASTDYASNSIVSTARAYSRALTAAEILQNFNATRTTYGI